MAVGGRYAAWPAVCLVILSWISLATGSNINVACSFNNCSSTENTYCRDGICSCLPGYKDMDHYCKQRTVGDPCTNDTDCSATDGSQCETDTCQCLPGYMAKNNSRVCVVRTIFDECKVNSDCSNAVANSYCDRNETCKCPEGYRLKGSVCVARRLGDDCKYDRDCKIVMNNTRCNRNKKCGCENGYLREDNHSCRLRRLGDSCSKNAECDHVGGQIRTCENKRCACANGYRSTVNDSTSAVECVEVKLGDACSRSSDCNHTVNSVCGLDSKCQCRPGHVRRSGANSEERCDAIQLNEGCLGDTDCQNVNNSVCVGGKCSCQASFTEDVGGRNCRARLLGDTCVLDSDCHVNNSVCTNNSNSTNNSNNINNSNSTNNSNNTNNRSSGVCSCIEGFDSSNGFSECTLKVVEETECSRHKDCLEHFPDTVCNDDGFCRCQDKYYLHLDGRECSFRYLGDRCNNDGECRHSVESSKCADNVCTCLDYYLPSPGRTNCSQKLLEGEPCSTDLECIRRVPHSSCNTGTCYCDTGYYSNKDFNLCVEKRLHDFCSSTEECNTTNANTFCSDKTQRCECLPKFVATSPPETNLSSVDAKPVCSERRIGDQSCQSVGECSLAIAESTCSACVNISDSLCHLLCSGDPSLHTHGFSTLDLSHTCPVGTCICEQGFLSDEDGRRCIQRKLHDPCLVNEDCSAAFANSVCLSWGQSQLCFCAPGFQAGGQNACVKRKIGDLCLQNTDCESAITHSHCNSSSSQNPGTCTCVSGHHATDDNTTCRRRQIGDRSCQVHADCSDAVNNSYCQQQMCVCPLGYYSSMDRTQCHKRRLRHDLCEADSHCQAAIANSRCLNYRCTCGAGFYNINDTQCTRRYINDRCVYGSDCSDSVTNSTCVYGLCRCASGFAAVGVDSCVRRKIKMSTCESLPDCADAVGNSSCRGGVCLCDLGYYDLENGTICVPRQLGDTCTEALDCSSVMANSECLQGHCTCQAGFDALLNDSRCVASPRSLNDVCYFVEQCQRVDPSSTCILTYDGRGRCSCPQTRFQAEDDRTCIPLPAKIGDRCRQHGNCRQAINNSECKDRTCSCVRGYFVDANLTTCHPEPQSLGDLCQEDWHCNITLDKSKCEQENNTCVCVYGYTQNTATSCVERPRLPQHVPMSQPRVPTCQDSCPTWPNSRCVLPPSASVSQCHCDYRHARSFNSTECQPVQTYHLELLLASQAGTYDYLPLDFPAECENLVSPVCQEMANRITLNGLMALFSDTRSASPLKDRYVTSEINGLDTLPDTGLKATVLLHITAKYYDPISVGDLYSFLEENLHTSAGVLGNSGLKLADPYSQALTVTDFDECSPADGRCLRDNCTNNDCSRNATCINTLGSFMCVCKSRYDDVSKASNLRQGRVCIIPSTTAGTSDLCSSDDCQTRWEFVVLAVTLFLLIVLAFITYEIIQRKQTFTARKLYEKFGTTNIRKLRQASMQRLQERKNRTREQNMIKKEEKRQKTEELKRERSEKKRLKDEERRAKQEAQKQKDLEKRQAKRASKAKSDNDVEWLGQNEETEDPNPAVEGTHPPASPTTRTDQSPTAEISSLPGSVNTPELEMAFPRRLAPSSIEESNV